jgi:hypothetical protein
MPTIAEERPLKDEERRLMEWLLQHGEPEAVAYLAQLDRTSVVSRCDCGCPSVDLAVDGRAASSSGPSDMLGDVIGVSPEGVDVGVILHARGGLLSELEIYSRGDLSKSYALPEINTLKLLPVATPNT